MSSQDLQTSQPTAATPETDSDDSLERGLGNRHLQLIAIGSAICRTATYN